MIKKTLYEAGNLDSLVKKLFSEKGCSQNHCCSTITGKIIASKAESFRFRMKTLKKDLILYYELMMLKLHLSSYI